MHTNLSFSFRNLLPQLSGLIENVSDWLNHRTTHEVESGKWRAALASVLSKDMPISDTTLNHTANSFKEAFSVYKVSQNGQHARTLTLNDFENAKVLDQSWKGTMRIVEQQVVLNPAVTDTNNSRENFMHDIAYSVARSTTRDAIELFDTRSVALAIRSSDFLSKACAATKATEEYIFPEIQKHRIGMFCKLQENLESTLAMGSYSGTPLLEEHLREVVLQNKQALAALQSNNDKVLTVRTKAPDEDMPAM